MGVSIDIYRIRIGTHVFKMRGPKLISSKSGPRINCSSKTIPKTCSSDVIGCLAVYFFIYMTLNTSSAVKTLQIQNQSYKFVIRQNSVLVKLHELNECVHSSGNKSTNNFLQTLHDKQNNSRGLRWGSNLSINKSVHILYGNRRNLGYKYFSWNCDRGILSKKKIEDIRVFASRHKPHLMGISEVDLRRNENNIDDSKYNDFSTEQAQEALKIEGYRLIFPSSWIQHGKARIIVYALDEIKTKIINDDPVNSHLQHVMLEVGFGKAKTHFVNFYYREWKSIVTGNNSTAAQNEEFERLTNIWRSFTAQDKDFLALGDTNICAKKIDDPNYIHKSLAETFKDFLIEENCFQIVEDYTRVRMVNNEIQRSCLDHVSVNCVDKVVRPEVLGIGKSDHLGLLVTKKTRELRTSPRTVKKRVYKNFDQNDFLKDILLAKESGLFDEMNNTEDIEVAGDIFTGVYTKILDKHAPLKVIQNRCNYVPYISNELKCQMKQRDLLKKSAAQSGDTDTYKEYQKVRNEVTTKLKTAEAEYYRSKFKETSDSKTLWTTAYQVLRKNRSDFPSQMMFGTKLLSKPLEIANAMNQFFVDKISKLKEEPRRLDEPLTELKRFLATKYVPAEGFKLKELSEGETLKLIKRLKGKKSCGMDWICGYSLKIAAGILLPEIRTLVNLTLRHGKYYSHWKKTKVLPGFKNKGSKFDAKFYRPISNLSEVSKIPEMAVHDQLYQYLNENHLLHPDHHGFLKHRSTTTALQQLMDIWLKAAEDGKLSAAILLDLSAGFDVINHEILLSKLKEYGLNDTALSWFEDYLSNRSQCVQIESKLSSFLQVPWGVPQGSILGPLLFVIFINELPESIKQDMIENVENTDEAAIDDTNDDHVVVYADDNTPTTSAYDPLKLQNKIQVIANRVTDWFSRNDMVVSGEKTKLLFLGTQMNRSLKIQNQNFVPKVEVSGEVVSGTQSEKLLGLVMNDTMTWKNQLYGDDENIGLLRTLSKRVGVLKKLRRYMPSNKFKQALAGLFTSKLIYGICVWTGVWGIPGYVGEDTRTSISKKDMYRLQSLQNKSLRLVNWTDRSTPTLKLLSSTGSLSVHQLGAYHTLVQVYKVKTSKEPEYHYERLFGSQPSDSSQTRVYFKLCLGRGSFFYQGYKLWAALPGSIKCISNTISFKKKCKEWVKTNIRVKP